MTDSERCAELLPARWESGFCIDSLMRPRTSKQHARALVRWRAKLPSE
jgi:hypothetical protein